MKRANCLRWAAVLASLAAALTTAAAAAAPGQLRFREDGTFTIAQLTDMHYGQSPKNDRLTDQVQTAVLAAEQPDFAAFGGDQVSGFSFDGSSGWYEARLRQLLQPTLATGIPRASILGNHDGEADLSRREIVRLERQLGGNLTRAQEGPRYLGPSAGNYWLDVLNATGEGVAARIWFLDSGSMGCEEMADGWGCVPTATVAWLEERAAQLTPVTTSLAFVHIPLPQFMEVWNSQPTRGKHGEAVACPLRDTGLFEAFRRVGIQAVYSGHDHLSDFYGTLAGVRLAYGRKTGYGNYGPAGARGARIIRLSLGQSAAESGTWIRTEAGEVEDQGGEATLPEAKRMQHACGANHWLWQRLHYPSFVSALLTCLAAGAALVAATAATTVCFMRRRWRGGRKAPLEAGLCEEEEEEEQLAFLRKVSITRDSHC